MKISLCMIVKNEEENIINCLDRALGLVDEAIVVDTGSTDKTKDILMDNYVNNNKVKVVEEKWENDFSKARNKSLEYATGDWILVLDADERVFCDRNRLEVFLGNSEELAYKIPIYNIFDKNNFTISAAMIRLYKNINPKYKGAIHEQIQIDGQSYPGKILDENICKIYHYGYNSNVFKEKNKIRRNIDIINVEIEKNSKDPFNWYNKGVMEMISGDYNTALDDFIKAHNLTGNVRMSYHNDLLMRMIQSMMMLKNYKLAASFIEHISKDSYINVMPDIYYYLGICYVKLKKCDLAINNFQKAVDVGEYFEGISKFGTGSFLSMIEWAKVLILQKKKEDAIKKYKEAVFNKNNIGMQGLDELRKLLQEENMVDELEQLDKTVSNINSKEEIVNNNELEKFKKEFKDSIQLLIENGMIKEAKEAIKEYEKIVNNDINIYSIKGVIAIMEGDMDEAEMTLKEGLELDEANFDLLYNIAYLYQSNSQNELAIEYYEKALQNTKNENDVEEICMILKQLGIKESKEEILRCVIPNTSIVILTYNNLEYNKLCLESIRKYAERGTYEIIVVDNHSTDGTVEWLKTQKNLKLILNDENLGFPKGCNQGIEAAKKDNDILLLNNDVVVTPNWLKNLKKCLYSSYDIGAAGSVTNSCSNYQTIPASYTNLDEMFSFAASNNTSNESLWEERLRLVGFCMLIKNEIVKKVGILDEIFTPGNFEDDDYSFRIREAGYRLMLCKDSFIHHFGSASFGKVSKEYSELLTNNRRKFAEKWGFDPYHIMEIKKEITELINRANKKDNINILHIGCAGGGTLLDIKNTIPSAKLYGIEIVKEAVVNTSHFANIETGKLKEIKTFKKDYFDYIIVTQPQENEKDILEILRYTKEYLNDEGIVYICLYKDKVTLSNKLIKKFIGEIGNYKFELIKVNDQQIFCMMKYCIEEPLRDLKLTFYRAEDLDQINYNLLDDSAADSKALIKVIRRLDNNIDFENNLEIFRSMVRCDNIKTEDLKSIILKHGIDKINLFNIVGVVYYQFNFIDKGLMFLEEAFKLDNKSNNTIYNIAYVLHQINENKLALEFLKNINTIDDDSELQQLKQQIEEAI